VAVRLPQLADSLDHILAALERRRGRPLAELDRKAKQEIVRGLEARGAFAVRHGVETVASALGVSRFTVYNYLNREKGSCGAEAFRHPLRTVRPARSRCDRGPAAGRPPREFSTNC